MNRTSPIPALVLVARDEPKGSSFPSVASALVMGAMILACSPIPDLAPGTGDDSTPIAPDDDTPPEDDDTSSGDDDSTPVQDDDGTPVQDDDTSVAPDDDSAASDDDSAAPDDDTSPPPAVPNGIVLIVIDTLRGDRLGCPGGELGWMPEMEARGGEGTCFEDVRSSSPWTGPGTASLLTGLHPPTHGVRDVESEALAEGVSLLPDLLRPSGFVSMLAAANPMATRYGIEDRFDWSYSLHGGTAPGGLDPDVWILGNADVFLEAAAITPESRFFAHFQILAPHDPYCPPMATETIASGVDLCDPDNASLVQDLFLTGDPAMVEAVHRLYNEEVTFADQIAASILERFVVRGLSSTTLFIITADHGEELGEQGTLGHSTEVNVHQTRVPLLMFGPGIPPGIGVSGVVSTVDLVPTILELLGISVPSGIEGRSLLPLLEGGSVPPYRTWAMVEREDGATRLALAASMEEDGSLWTLVRRGGTESGDLLFDVGSDPLETTNLIKTLQGEAPYEWLDPMMDAPYLDWDAWLAAWYGG